MHVPLQQSLPGSHAYGNRANLLGVSLKRMVEMDVIFLHTTGAAGRSQGAQKAAVKSVKIHEATRRKQHAKVGTSRYTNVTLAHETHGRLGDEAKEQIRM